MELQPSPETRRALMNLAATHLGEIVGDAQVINVLGGLPLVECTDDQFRAPREAYFTNELVIAVLGSEAPLAKPADVPAAAMQDLLKALGVRDTPRPADILRRVEQLTAGVQDAQSKSAMRALFTGLVDCWARLSEEDKEELEELRGRAWLPAEGKGGWFQPNQVYSTFQKFLFASQGTFLDVPQPVQQRGTLLLDFLGIKTPPPLLLVVKHLLHCAQAGSEVNEQVYETLSRSAEKLEIAQLVGQQCLRLSDGRYIRGNLAFWGQHPFGACRVRLSEDWRRFAPLLAKLGVRDAPDPKVAAEVLQELAAKNADNRLPDAEDRKVTLQCWEFLSRFEVDTVAEVCEGLNRVKAVPNANGFFRIPREMFFDDRPGLVAKFGDRLNSHVIPRPEAAGPALELAGVRALSSEVLVEAVERENPVFAEDHSRRLADRWGLVRRVLASVQTTRLNKASTECPPLWSVDRLVVVHRVLGLQSDAEKVDAQFETTEQRIYFVQGGSRVWLHVAREIAFRFVADASAGTLTAPIRDVLTAADPEEAKGVLDELGIPRVDLAAGEDSQEEEAAGMGAGATPTDQGAGQGAPPAEDGAGAKDEGREGDSEPSNQTGAAGGTGTPPGTEGREGQSNQGQGGKGGGADQNRTKPSRKKQTIGRTYVSPEGDSGAEMSEDAKDARSDVDKKGIARAMANERGEGRTPKEMPHWNKGYDIESRVDGAIERYIEVKALSDAWGVFGVKLSPDQFDMARKEKGRFWLYVVENAGTDAEALYTIQDPATKVVEYRFDDGWKVVAKIDSTPVKRSLKDVIAARKQESPSEGSSGGPGVDA